MTLMDVDVNCLTAAWADHCGELRDWLRRHLRDPAEADDLLQDLFLKAWRQGERFCAVQNPRAWFFEVARNTLTDHLRARPGTVALPDELAQGVTESDTVDQLCACLPRVLSELNADDRDILTACDLHGMPQADYAVARGLSLSATKSRIQRARTRLKAQLSVACQVRLDAQGCVEDFVPRPPLPS